MFEFGIKKFWILQWFQNCYVETNSSNKIWSLHLNKLKRVWAFCWAYRGYWRF